MSQFEWSYLAAVLALAEHGSFRRAASHLGISHATVSRHLKALEALLGDEIFDRREKGFVPTPLGVDVIAAARRMEGETAALNLAVMGHDQSLSGVIRFTVPGALTEALVMKIVQEFRTHHPAILIEVISSYDHLDLSKREADVALRICTSPPDHLVGVRVAEAGFAVYGRKSDLQAMQDKKPLGFVGEDDGRSIPFWWPDGVPMIECGLRTNDPLTVYHMVRSGSGVGLLACCVGDADAELVRMPEPFRIWPTDMWLLTHREVRKAARIRVFTDFVAKALRKHRVAIEGRA